MPILKAKLGALRWVVALCAMLAAGVLLVPGRTTGVVSAQSGSVLVQSHHMVYEGAFRLPGQTGPGGTTGDHNSFNGGGESVTLSESRNSLFLTGSRCCADPADAGASTVAEITIPEIRNVSSIGALATANYIQPHADAMASRQGDIGCRGPIGGLLPWAGRLLISAYCYYDAAYIQIKSHFSTAASALGTNVYGPAEIQSPATGGGRAGFVSGYMTTIPTEWQAALGGNALTGNCCIPIITRTSWGPAASVFNAGDVGVRDPVPATAVVGYPSGNPLDGNAGCDSTSTLFNCATTMGGVIFPAGTSSVLFFGTHGTGPHCYGTGTTDPALHGVQVPNEPGNYYCYDLAGGSKGPHAYPYHHYVWAYDANELVAVKNGQKAFWQVRPYAVWSLQTPFATERRSVSGVTYDPVTQRVFVGFPEQDAPRPLIHVFRLQTGTAPPPADTVVPTVSLTSPANGAAVTGAVTLSAAASDNVGVAGVWFTVDGNTVGSEDTTAPYQVSWSSASASNGSHVIRAVVRDAAGNTASSSTATVTVSNSSTDTTAPTVSLTAPSAGTTVNGLVTMSALASDNVGVASVQFWINGSLAGTATSAPYSMGWNTSVAANAPHTLHAVARDAAGNSTASQTVSVTVNNTTADTTDPAVSVTSPASGASVSGTVTLTAAASDNSAVASVEFRVDGVLIGAPDTTAPYQVSWVTTAATNGSRTLQARAVDTSGNDNTSALVTVNVNNAPQDTTPPTVNVTAPAAGSTVSGTVTVSASAADNVGIAGVQFTLDGVNLGVEDTAAPYSIGWTTTGATNGTHVLRAVARDMGGAVTSSGPVSVTVSNTSSDSTRPTVSMTAPASNAVVSNTITVSASASDNVGVVGVQFTLDDVNLGSADSTAPYSISWTTNGTVNGYHTLRAVAQDAAGNTRTSSGRSVYVSNSSTDTSAPSVTISAPGPGSTVSGTVNISATGSDNVAVVGVQFAADGVPVGTEDTTAPFERPWATTSALNRSYVLTATARDAAGNRSTSPGVTVKVKNLGKGKPGDLNDDGLADLLFSHDTGKLYAWHMNGDTLIGDTTVTPDTVNPVWQVASIDDFDGDKKSDYVWQHSVTGQVYLWFMDRSTLVGEAALVNAGEYRVAATGDLNGDGKADIVWRNPSTGQMRVSLMDGTTTITDTGLTPGVVDPSWRVAGASDLNGDGKADLVWQNNATGALAYWLMNGAATISSGALTPTAVNVTWQIRAVEDFDRDGYTDLVFQHASSGQLYIWYLEGTTLDRHGYLTPSQVGPGWRIVGRK